MAAGSSRMGRTPAIISAVALGGAPLGGTVACGNLWAGRRHPAASGRASAGRGRRSRGGEGGGRWRRRRAVAGASRTAKGQRHGSTSSLLGLLDFQHRFSSSTSPSSSCVWLRLDREPRSLMSERDGAAAAWVLAPRQPRTRTEASSGGRRRRPWRGWGPHSCWFGRRVTSEGPGLEATWLAWRRDGEQGEARTEALASTTGDHRRHWQKG